jgi:hypothetical protein
MYMHEYMLKCMYMYYMCICVCMWVCMSVCYINICICVGEIVFVRVCVYIKNIICLMLKPSVSIKVVFKKPPGAKVIKLFTAVSYQLL